MRYENAQKRIYIYIYFGAPILKSLPSKQGVCLPNTFTDIHVLVELSVRAEMIIG